MHGFRALFSTIANETGFNPDAIERQLAHREKNAVRAAYHRSEYLLEREKMMQWWADHLQSLEYDTDRAGNE
jgi:integrase